MSADEIAPVLADLLARKLRVPKSVKEDDATAAVELLQSPDGPVVVDATAIHRSLVESDKEIMIYEDHPCVTPPWPSALICFSNEHGNVVIQSLHTVEIDDAWKADPPWQSTAGNSWDDVRWATLSHLWVGGRSAGKQVPTSGPFVEWRFAINQDGSPADIHWTNLVPEYEMGHWDMALATFLGALNFLNCQNVKLVEPDRPRAERRRIEKILGRTVIHEINVLPISRRTKGGINSGERGVPLHSVRGHFSSYGEEYGRGLLFGRLSGRYWIAQHARGKAEIGIDHHTYRLSPASH